MSTKYYRLLSNMEGRSDSEWSTTFSEIEEVMKSKLPPSAAKFSSWWANRPVAQGRIWLSAGWRVANVDLEEQRVTFVRFVEPAETGDRSKYPLARARSKALGLLTVAEAKAGLAMNFGVSVSRIQIVVRL